MATVGTATGLVSYADYYIRDIISRFGLRQSSGYRAGAVTEFGTRSLHGLRLASDLTGSPANMQAAYNYAKDLSNIKEVIYRGKIYTPSGGERHYRGHNQHTDHVHVGFNTGVNSMVPSGKTPAAGVQGEEGSSSFYFTNPNSWLPALVEPIAKDIFTGLLYCVIGIIILVSMYKVFEPEAKTIGQTTLKVASKGVL